MDIKIIQKRLQVFANERDWNQFHNPKNLAMALSVEASELVEIFQWLTPEDALNLRNDPIKIAQASEEIADISLYLLRLADKLGVDIESAINSKLEKNAIKYPIEKSKGNAKKYTEL